MPAHTAPRLSWLLAAATRCGGHQSPPFLPQRDSPLPGQPRLPELHRGLRPFPRPPSFGLSLLRVCPSSCLQSSFAAISPNRAPARLIPSWHLLPRGPKLTPSWWLKATRSASTDHPHTRQFPSTPSKRPCPCQGHQTFSPPEGTSAPANFSGASSGLGWGGGPGVPWPGLEEVACWSVMWAFKVATEVTNDFYSAFIGSKAHM